MLKTLAAAFLLNLTQQYHLNSSGHYHDAMVAAAHKDDVI